MTKQMHIAVLACITIAASILSTSAYALASSLTVSAPNTTKLSLFNRSGAEVASGDGNLSATNIQPGYYELRAQTASGEVKTTPVQVEADTSCNYSVGESGEAVRVRCVPLMTQQQQQQQDFLSFVFLGGIKRTPFDAHVTSNTIPAAGDIGMEDRGGIFSVESRYHFPNADGTRDHTFAYGGIDWYAGLRKTRRTLDFHAPVPGDETGAKVDEKYGVRLGIGKSWDIGNKWGLELMGGAHLTRVSTSIITNENNPQDTQFKKSKFVVGPSVGLGLTFPLYNIPGVNRPVMGTARYTANWMPDINVDGMALFDYHANIDGGRQDIFQLGVITSF
jgi:hypothetical protein